MTSIALLLLGSVSTAVLRRRADRTAWVAALTSATLAWLAALLERRSLPLEAGLFSWDFLPGAATQIRWTVTTLEWRVTVYVCTALLILLLARAIQPHAVASVGLPGLLLAGALGLAAWGAANAITLALLLPLSIVSQWWSGRAPHDAPEFDHREGDRLWLQGMVAFGLGWLTWIRGEAAWPSAASLLGLFALWMLSVGFGASANGSDHPVVVFQRVLLPSVVGLKLLVPIDPGSLSAASELWVTAAAALVALFALARAWVRRNVNGSVIAAATTGLAAIVAVGNAGLPVGMDGLAASLLLCGTATLQLAVRRTADRALGASSLAIVILFTIFAGSGPGSADLASGILRGSILVAASAGLLITFGRAIFSALPVAAHEDALAALLFRVSLMLPLVMGLGIGLASLQAPGGAAAAMGLISLVLAAGALRSGAQGEAASRRRWDRTFDWLDPRALASASGAVLNMLARGVRTLMGLLEGGGGVLWAWAILLGLLLLQGTAS